jgi:hypothetical protein
VLAFLNEASCRACSLENFRRFFRERGRKALGRHDASYKNDFIPAYSLNEGWKTGQDTWQLVFLPDSNMKILEVFVHKNCCQK